MTELSPGKWFKDGSNKTIVVISMVDEKPGKAFGKSYFYRDGGDMVEIDSKDKMWLIWKHKWERVYE